MDHLSSQHCSSGLSLSRRCLSNQSSWQAYWQDWQDTQIDPKEQLLCFVWASWQVLGCSDVLQDLGLVWGTQVPS